MHKYENVNMHRVVLKLNFKSFFESLKCLLWTKLEFQHINLVHLLFYPNASIFDDNIRLSTQIDLQVLSSWELMEP